MRIAPLIFALSFTASAVAAPPYAGAPRASDLPCFQTILVIPGERHVGALNAPPLRLVAFGIVRDDVLSVTRVCAMPINNERIVDVRAAACVPDAPTLECFAFSLHDAGGAERDVLLDLRMLLRWQAASPAPGDGIVEAVLAPTASISYVSSP